MGEVSRAALKARLPAEPLDSLTVADVASSVEHTDAQHGMAGEG